MVFFAVQQGLKVVSSMGVGGKTDPGRIQIADISKSSNCKLPKVFRYRLAQLGVKKGVKVVFSPEDVDNNAVRIENSRNKKSTVGTVSYMPPLFGCFVSSMVIRDVIN